MNKKTWGIFVTEKEVEQMREKIEQKGYEIFEVRKLNFWERLMYCKDPILYANDPWIIMFEATRLQYYSLIWKSKLTPVF